MKQFNLDRLMMSCCVDIDDEYYEELMDYLLEVDVDLNMLNIDDLTASLNAMGEDMKLAFDDTPKNKNSKKLGEKKSSLDDRLGR